MFNYKGRANRREFLEFLIAQAIIIYFMEIGFEFAVDSDYMPELYVNILILIESLIIIAFLTADLALFVRRIRDSNLSGWHLLWLLTFGGALWVGYLFVRKGVADVQPPSFNE